MKVLIVGDTPSRLNDDPNKAFEGAACYPKLVEWIKAMDITEYELINSDTDRDLLYIYEWVGPIIALGKNAQKRLKRMQVNYIPLPHPSGRNRQLNDRWQVAIWLVEARQKLMQS